MKKSIYLSIGFLLIIIGFSALFLSIVGVKFSFLAFIDRLGGFYGLIIRLLMILSGFVIVALNVTNWREENEE